MHWRSTGLTDEWVKADLGADTAIRAIAIRYSNLRVGDTLNLQAQTAANGDDWDGTPALTLNVSVTITAAMVTAGVIVYNWTSDQTVRYVRILMTATSHPDGYIRIGRIYLGTYVEPDNDYDKDHDDSPVDPSDVLTTPGGQKYVNVRPQRRRITLTFSAISAADHTKFDALRAALGKSYAFFVELDPADLTRTYYVSAVTDWKMPHVYGAQHWQMALSLEEEG